MVSQAVARFVKVSPRKVRLVIDLVRGENAQEALDILANLDKRAATYVERALKSAINSAKLKSKLDAKDLNISKITADGGPMLTRYKAQAMGRATVIRKRTTHIHVELERETPFIEETVKQKKPKLRKKEAKDGTKGTSD